MIELFIKKKSLQECCGEILHHVNRTKGTKETYETHVLVNITSLYFCIFQLTITHLFTILYTNVLIAKSINKSTNISKKTRTLPFLSFSPWEDKHSQRHVKTLTTSIEEQCLFFSCAPVCSMTYKLNIVHQGSEWHHLKEACEN